jgi:asparagine synthase (glutamine-hydrolysing)
LKGEIVGRGVKAITGIDMPLFAKRRFQHGAIEEQALRSRLGQDESGYRRAFHALYA